MARLMPGFDGLQRSLSAAYWERRDKDPSWPDQVADLLYDKIWRPVAERFRPPAKTLRQILPLAARHEPEYRTATDDQLRAVAKALRPEFRRHGLKPSLVGQSLALIREVAFRTLDKRPHDVQMMGAWALLQGHLTEMATGEGKTLTAALAVASAALTGMPVHVVTVNDYLAERDAQIMIPIYQFLGLTTGTVTNGIAPDERRAAYRCDITYCTNKELAFDYLKDRVALAKSGGPLQMTLDSLNVHAEGETSQLLLRGLYFAIVDEADSIFVDEAVTPLILSASVNGGQESEMYQTAIEFARTLQAGIDYVRHERERRIELTKIGKDLLEEFAQGRSGVWTSRRAGIEIVHQALNALYMFERDQQYVVVDGKVAIVDESTGRVMADRSWENGLHQLIETKEGCAISDRRVTLARISYQRLFRRYMMLAGMTGTGQEVAAEIWSVYRLRTVAIPQHRQSLRKQFPAHMYPDIHAKWRAVAERVRTLALGESRAVLIGTRSVEASEQLSEVLRAANIEHVLLNAKQDQTEAEAVAQAGKPGRVTVATNLAGRGTDIHIDPRVVTKGGLHVILTECHSSARVDRQLIGRGARQGDPGSYEMIVSLEDDILRIYAAPLIRVVRRWVTKGSTQSKWLLPILQFIAQTRAQHQDSQGRRVMLKMDKQLDKTLAFSGVSE